VSRSDKAQPTTAGRAPNTRPEVVCQQLLGYIRVNRGDVLEDGGAASLEGFQVERFIIRLSCLPATMEANPHVGEGS
jgi:hypothetical protein